MRSLVHDDIACVLFDLDGTLIDTVDLIRTSMRHATQVVLGRVLPDEILMKNVGVPLLVQMGDFDAELAEELVRVYRAHNAEVHDSMVREYPGTHEALDALAESGKRLGVVTSKSRPVAMRGLDLFGLSSKFELIIASDDVRKHKPDPFPLVEAASRLGLDPTECAYVGDSPHDMNAALGAGCLSIAALWGAFPSDVLLAPGPSYAAPSIASVVRILEGNGTEFLCA